MIPIYLIRDDWNNLTKNKAIFKQCFQILNNNEAFFIAPEGSHSILRKVRPLSKGFTRIIFGALVEHPNLNIQIIPIGLNFDTITSHPSSVSIRYEKPINANQYYDKNNIETLTNTLKRVVRNEMKKLTTHIENPETYDVILDKLKALNADFTNPIEANKIIENIDAHSIKTPTKIKKSKKTAEVYSII